jgi:hypothetical protein
MIDYLSVYLPTKYVFQPVIAYALPYIRSANPRERKAGQVSLAVRCHNSLVAFVS